jgi:hypothetical protein
MADKRTLFKGRKGRQEVVGTVNDQVPMPDTEQPDPETSDVAIFPSARKRKTGGAPAQPAPKQEPVHVEPQPVPEVSETDHRPRRRW